MFNAGLKDLALEPAPQKKLDRPINRNLDEFKIDPLKFEDVSTGKGPDLAEDPVPIVTGTTKPDPAKRQPVTELAAIPPKEINKLIRLEPMIDNREQPATKAIARPDNKTESLAADGARDKVFEHRPDSVPIAIAPETASGGDFIANATSNASMTTTIPLATKTKDGNRNDFTAAGMDLPENANDSSPPMSELVSFVSSQMQQLIPPFANHPDDVPIVESERRFEQVISSSMDPNTDDSVSDLVDVPSEPAATVSASHAVYSESRLTWQHQLRRTIEVFEDEIDQALDSTETEKLKTALAILQALETDFGNQATQDDSSESELKDYWSHQIQAVNELLKHSTDGNGSSPSASLALEHLHLAVNELAAVADLKLAFTAFCTKVTGFGQYTPFENSEFSSDQSVLVYCEIENFAPLLETQNGTTNYQTQLSSSFWITNDAEAIVQQQDYPAVTDNARNLRRDFFMHLPVTFAKLPSGKYALHIKVRDHGSGKTAMLEQAMKFSIR